MTATRKVLFVLAVFVSGLVILSLKQADAGGDHYRGHRSASGYCATDFWGRCVRVAKHRHAYRWRYYNHRRTRLNRHRHRHRQHWAGRRPHVPGAGERIDHGLQCQARRRVVGEEKASKAKAERAADNAWMGAVRYDHGERYQDLNNARDVRHNCDPSSTTTILKRVFFRCVIEATPCRAPLGESAERVQRNYEEDLREED